MRKSFIYFVVGAIVSLSFGSQYVSCNQSIDAIYEAGKKIYPDVNLGDSLTGTSKKQLYVAVYKFLDKADKEEKKIEEEIENFKNIAIAQTEKVLQEDVIPMICAQLYAFDFNIEEFVNKLVGDEQFLSELTLVILNEFSVQESQIISSYEQQVDKILSEINTRGKKQYLQKLEEQLNQLLEVELKAIREKIARSTDQWNQWTEKVSNALLTEIEAVCQKAVGTPSPICTTVGDDATALASKIQNFDQYISVLSKYFRLNLRWADKLPVSKKKIPVKVSSRVKPLIQHIDKLKKGKVTLLSWQTVEKVFKSGGSTVQNNAYTRVAVILAEWLLYTQKNSIIDSGKDISEIMEKISAIVDSHYKNDPLREMSKKSIEEWRTKIYSAIVGYVHEKYAKIDGESS